MITPSRRPLTGTLAILVGIILFTLILHQLPILGTPYTSVTMSEVIAQRTETGSSESPRPSPLTLWQGLTGNTVFSQRALSLLLLCLTFASVFQLARSLGKQGGWAVIVLALLLSGAAYQSWSTLFSVRLCLATISTVLAWRLNQLPASRRVLWTVYVFASAGMVIAYWPMILLLILHQAVGIITSHDLRRQVRLAGIAGVTLLVAILFGILSRQDQPPFFFLSTTPLISAYFRNSTNQMMYLLVALWVVVSAIFLSLFLDTGSVARGSQSARDRITIFIGAWLIAPLIVGLVSGDWALTLLVVLSVPLSLGIVRCASLVSLRVQLAIGSLFVVLVLVPQPVPMHIHNLVADISPWYVPGTPVLVNLAKNTAQAVDIADQLIERSMLPLDYIMANQVITIQASGEVSILPLADFPYPDGAAYWVIGGDEVIKPGQQHREPVFSTGSATLYQAIPARDIIYLFGPLALLDFNLDHQSQSFAPGQAVMLNTWWLPAKMPHDNFLLSANLLNKDGQPVAVQDNLLSQSYTGTWQVGTLHFDRRAIQLPENLPAGNYNLVLTVRGTVGDTANLPVFLTDNKPVGEFGYLTTITVSN